MDAYIVRGTLVADRHHAWENLQNQAITLTTEDPALFLTSQTLSWPPVKEEVKLIKPVCLVTHFGSLNLSFSLYSTLSCSCACTLFLFSYIVLCLFTFVGQDQSSPRQNIAVLWRKAPPYLWPYEEDYEEGLTEDVPIAMDAWGTAAGREINNAHKYRALLLLAFYFDHSMSRSRKTCRDRHTQMKI